jgi:hypothetical protein
MKYRIALWASAGFLVALGWALIALATHPASTEGLVWTLASLTCPIAFARYLPISIYTVLAANALPMHGRSDCGDSAEEVPPRHVVGTPHPKLARFNSSPARSMPRTPAEHPVRERSPGRRSSRYRAVADSS